MGYYIQCKNNFRKAEQIVADHGALVLPSVQAAREAFKTGGGVVCVVENGFFDAAAFCYSEREIDAFSMSSDPRRRTWLLMDKKRAAELSGYKL